MSAAQRRRLASLEAGLSAITGLLAIVSVFWHDWIEAVTGSDPDHHNGSVEWLIVAGLAIICIVLGIAARRSWRGSRGVEPVTAAD